MGFIVVFQQPGADVRFGCFFGKQKARTVLQRAGGKQSFVV
jgi:hypothetical protein